ncbi:MAG: hypothetical protein H0S85_10855 [Desulfovibrionaceae bacterium]|nr:hypothetical protein [Desulfovibrionaceae bacterium]
MYVNLILGVLFVYLVFRLGRRWARREGSPRTVLREEMERERALRASAAEGARRVRELSAKQLGPVLAAFAEMRAELDDPAAFEFEEDEGEIFARVGQSAWKLRFEPAQIDLEAPASLTDGLFILEAGDGAREVLRDVDAVVRHFARILARTVEGPRPPEGNGA